MNRIFSQHTELDGIFFKHARGLSDRSGREFHTDHEIIYFLDGDAEFISERLRMHLKSKTVIWVPKETYHQMIVHGDPENYYRCFVQFPNLPEHFGPATAHMPQIKAVMADDEMEYLFQKMIRTPSMAEEDAAPILKAALTLLLNAILQKEEVTGKEDHQSEIIRAATRYIDKHIGEKILVADIAAAINVSVSSLSHIFKREMNISLHQFMLRKRLVAAHHKIADGQPATSAAMEFGFHDYSGFYKQYKKMFGFSPSGKGR